MNARVLIFRDAAFEPELTRVVGACARLGMTWSAPDDAGSDVNGVEFAVGFLPVGERRVPKRILRALAARGDRTPLILLSRERLTQPTLWLEGSLLVLMGDTPNEQQIASRLRMLDASAADHEKAGFKLREVRRSRFFAATFSNCIDRLPCPRMLERADEWIALLPLDEQRPPVPQGRTQADTSLDLFGENCGVVRLGTSSGLLVANISPVWGSLTLASPRRAPGQFRFPAQAAADTRASLRTGSADLVVALSLSAEALTRSPAWTEALSAGAGGVLEFVEDQARAGGAVQGVVVEVL